MGRALAVVALVCVSLTSPTFADEAFPYVAYVLGDDVYVRSGPGENYYPTDKLARGTAVEVYRHDPGGWYAIRPPETSFSWVASDYVEPLEDNLARITGDRVAARVGSALNDNRDVIQVQFYRGEEVEVLGAQRVGDGPNARTWYKIAPPAGEFRWISGKFVDRQVYDGPPTDMEPYRNRLIPDDPLAQLARDKDALGAAQELAAGDVQDDSDVASRRVASRDPNFGVEPEAPAVDYDELRGEGGDSGPPVVNDVPVTVSSRPVSNDVTEELADIDLSLSRMVTSEPQTWEFEALRSRAERALSLAETALERGKARAVLSSIERFETIQRSYLATERLRVDSRAWEQQTARTDPRRIAANLFGGGSARYDGRGRLARVKSRRPGAPSYALLDERGAVASFVTPAPGVHLDSYVGQEVGIGGAIGYLPELDRQHVTARRVKVLGPNAGR